MTTDAYLIRKKRTLIVAIILDLVSMSYLTDITLVYSDFSRREDNNSFLAENAPRISLIFYCLGNLKWHRVRSVENI